MLITEDKETCFVEFLVKTSISTIIMIIINFIISVFQKKILKNSPNNHPLLPFSSCFYINCNTTGKSIILTLNLLVQIM